MTPLDCASKERLTKFEIDQRCLILSLAPTDDRFEYEFSILLGRENQFQLAEQHLKKAIELSPDAVEYWAQLGFVYKHTGKYKEAGDAFKVASEKFKGSQEDHMSINGTLIAF